MSVPLFSTPLASLAGDDASIIRLARILESGFAALALMAGLGLAAGACLARRGASDWQLMTAGCSFVLLAAGLGLGLRRAASSLPRLALSGLLSGIAKRLALRPAATKQPRALLWQVTPEEQLAEAVSRRVQVLNLDSAEEPDYMSAIRGSRAQTRHLVSELYRDADSLSEVSGRLETSGARLDMEAKAAAAKCQSVKKKVLLVTDDVVALTGLVGALTSDIRRLTTATADLSQRALDSQQSIAALDDGVPEMRQFLEAMRSGIERLIGLSKQAVVEATKSGEAGRMTAAISADSQTVLAAVLVSLHGMEKHLLTSSGNVSAWFGVAQEMAGAVQRMMEAQVSAQGLLGSQGKALTALMEKLDGAHGGIDQIQASLEEVRRYGAARAMRADDLRKTAARLPRLADNLAALLRDIPDYFPSQP